MVRVIDSSRLLLLSAPKVRKTPCSHVQLKEPLGMLDEMEKPLETVR
jgi:hypothetical protein